MVDERRAEPPVGHALRRARSVRRVGEIAPRPALAVEHPLQESAARPPAARLGVAEALAVEVVALRAFPVGDRERAPRGEGREGGAQDARGSGQNREENAASPSRHAACERSGPPVYSDFRQRAVSKAGPGGRIGTSMASPLSRTSKRGPGSPASRSAARSASSGSVSASSDCGKRAEVNGHVRPRAEVRRGPHGVVRAHVLRVHVPDRDVGADREDRESQAREAFGDPREVGAVPRVSGEEDGARGTGQDEAAPEPPVHVEEPAAGGMAGRHGGDGDARRDLSRLPPVEIAAARHPLFREVPGGAEAGEDVRLEFRRRDGAASAGPCGRDDRG